MLVLQHPIEHGVVTDWDAMEKLWRHSFCSVRADPATHPVLLTEPPLNPRACRERTVQMAFGNT